MEYVDVYDNKGEKLGYTKERNKLERGENRLSCFAWIINDKRELLVQQRVATAKNCPNIWETVSGGAIAGDTRLSGTIREIKEELGIDANPDNMELIGAYKRYNDFVIVYLLKQNVALEEIVMQLDEVQNVKYVKIEEYEKMIKEGLAVESGFDILKQYIDNYYNKYMVIVDGKRQILDYDE